MNYTKAHMIDAYTAGFLKAQARLTFGTPSFARDMAVAYAAEYLDDEWLDSSHPIAPRIAPEDITIDQPRFGHLPPNGTGEEVLARVLASLLCRTAMMFFDEDTKQFPVLFSTNWQESQLEALRTAYPILGALEDARVEETWAR